MFSGNHQLKVNMLTGKFFSFRSGVFALGVFGLSLHCYAATYYIDYLNGDDSNTGSSTALPWKHCPSDSVATGLAATALNSGDTIKFKGGVSYVYTSTNTTGFNLVSSGVTYDGNSDGSWGTGKAILTDNNSNPGHNAFVMNMALSNIGIRSFKMTQLGGSATLPPDTGSPIAPNAASGVYMSVSAQSILIADCDFSMIGYWFNQKPMNANSIGGTGVGASSANGGVFGGITVTNCTFARVAIGCDFAAGPTLTNITVANCTFSDSMVWCVDIAVRMPGTYTDGIAVHDCTFYDFYQYNQNYWTGYGGWPHVDGIFFRADYGGAVYGTNNNFYNNLFYSTQPQGGGTACIYVTEGENVNIYNNIFIHSGMQNGNISIGNGPLGVGSSSQTVNILNNTFYDNYTFDVNVGVNDATRPVQKLTVLNNIFYDDMINSGNNFVASYSAGNGMQAWMQTNWYVDNNLYRSLNVSQTYIYLIWGSGFGTDLTGARTIGWETNGFRADPLFANISYGLGVSCKFNNLHLQLGSPAALAGTNLTAQFSWLPGFTKDRAGAQRPATGKWDIGAYQLSIKPSPAAPLLLPIRPL